MINLELMEFIEREILPRYNNFDRTHSLSHVKNVIGSSLKMAKRLGANEDMSYVIAAYHDLGMEGPRAIHHLTGGKILISDRRLKKWFSAVQLKIMREAVEDHRASASKTPRSIYGKIVAEADRELTPDTVITRTIAYGMDHYPSLDKEEHYKRFVTHLTEKYSTNGYIRLWIPGSENETHLKNLREIIASPHLLRKHFMRIWDKLNETENVPR